MSRKIHLSLHGDVAPTASIRQDPGQIVHSCNPLTSSATLTSQLETTPKQTQHYLPLFMHFSETAQRPCRQYENLQSP
jgi:hypothetical protein